MEADYKELARQIDASAKIRPKAILFDYGNVLSLPQQPADVEEMAEVCGIASGRLHHLYWKFRGPYDSGELDARAYWDRVASEEQKEFSDRQIAQIVEIDARSWSRPNDDSLRWVEQLRQAGFPLALLSNMPLEIKDYLLCHCDWLQVFQSLVFSCDVRAVKPDPSIYAKCLEEIGLPPRQVLFFDDRQENVDGAAKTGMHAFLFDSVDQASARAAEKFDLPRFG